MCPFPRFAIRLFVNEIAKLLAAAQNSRLAVFVGAGVSMGPPTNLPSWRDVNRIVVRALASVAAPVVGERSAAKAAELILARHEVEKLPPEYQAQVLAEFLHKRYFEVLRHLDSDRPNITHLAIAWLARLGCIRAMITTNFDRVLESAFTAVDAPLERHFQPEHFRTLANDLGRFDQRDSACQLLKLHGSVDDPGTLIDTLAQRKRGFAAPVMDCVQQLLRSQHWLFLGFSGLDLEAEANYLTLASEADTAIGFTWFVREKTEPKPAVVRLKNLYGDRGEIVYGNLPDWLLNFTSVISSEPRRWIEKYSRPGMAAAEPANTTALEQSAAVWAAGLAPKVCAMSLAFVVSACAEPQAAVKLVEGVLRKIEEQWLRTSQPSPGSLLMKALAANALGILLAGLGRHDEAVTWITQAVDLAEQAGDDDTRDRFRGNLAASLETLGRIDEARDMYQAALAGYRTRDDPVPLGFGMRNLASHLIRQLRLDEARTFAEEAVSCAKRAGDERLRGTALCDLGMIAKLKGEYPEALKLFEECETLFRRLGNDDALAAAAGNRGEVLTALGKYDEAERIHLSVLQITQRLDRRDNEGATCLSLGTLNCARGDPAAAERWFTQGLEIFRAIKDPSNQAFALHRLASVKIDAGRFEEALALAQDALPLVSERNLAFTAGILEQIGRANLKLGWVVRAEEAYRKTGAIAEKLGAAKLHASSSLNLGTALLLQQRDDEAAAVFSLAAEHWRQLNDRENHEYCELGKAAVQLNQKIAALSDAGHRAPDLDQGREAAREMVRLYPDLIAMYEKIGAMQLVAAFCASAASTAQFAGDLVHAVDWYRQAAKVFQDIGLAPRALEALTRCEDLLKGWTNALMQKEQMAAALPLLLQLAEVCGQLGHREICATAMLNAAIALLQTSKQFEEARGLGEQAAALFSPDSDDATRLG